MRIIEQNELQDLSYSPPLAKSNPFHNALADVQTWNHGGDFTPQVPVTPVGLWILAFWYQLILLRLIRTWS